ncbi:alpha/beta hydrolase [Microbacterium sp. RG1]|uniref:alpha/beta hydrolase n=1 Tax=Microbacterium sp. RG1 TaxID=2489212 RepID=UPI0010CA3663|nr:alpha/beta fold hydrolase [Microbacterium sp. RG1]QCQ17730.1 alpha/beta fold hydrolase [Microbacterium sp. RG1]
MFEEIAFAVADGTVLRGRFYAATTEPGPVVVLAAGFAGTMDLRLIPFAERFHAAGLNVLIYDHRGFGLSEGVIRQEVDPFAQINDWREAITVAQLRPEVDPERVGIWGTSYSGGEVLQLGATDRRVKVVVSQVPYISGFQTMARQVRADHQVEAYKMFAGDRINRMSGNPPMMMPIITDNPATPAVLPTQDAWDFTQSIIHEAPTWRNEVTVRSMELSGAFEPALYVSRISPRPLLIIVGRNDLLTTPDLAFDTYAKALEPKELVILDGGHFDPYDRLFDEAATPAAAWFATHL